MAHLSVQPRAARPGVTNLSSESNTNTDAPESWLLSQTHSAFRDFAEGTDVICSDSELANS